MPVYVDELVDYTNLMSLDERRGMSRNNQHYYSWCHMWGDDLVELMAIAESLHLKFELFQHNHIVPHYNLIPEKRAMAIYYGAIPTTRQHLVIVTKQRLIRYGRPLIPK